MTVRVVLNQRTHSLRALGLHQDRLYEGAVAVHDHNSYYFELKQVGIATIFKKATKLESLQ